MTHLVTPTGFRPVQFARLEKIMARQTVELPPWTVVDDSDDPVTPTMGQTLLTPKHRHNGPTLGSNMLAFMQEVDPERVIILEDDVYYCEEYIETMLRLLDHADLVGYSPAFMYHVNKKMWLIANSKIHASWSETALKGKALAYMFKCIKRFGMQTKLDMQLWRRPPQTHKDQYTKYLVKLNPEVGIPVAVSMKGEGQARTLGRWHDGKGMKPDPDLTKLRSWIGDEGVGLYYENETPDTTEQMELPPDSICDSVRDEPASSEDTDRSRRVGDSVAGLAGTAEAEVVPYSGNGGTGSDAGEGTVRD